jgi:hypothetical protein
MQFTPKKLKVTANITMAYIINYLNKYCSMPLENAFSSFVSSETYRTLMNLKSRLCLEMAPDVLFMYMDEMKLSVKDDDMESFHEAFNISEILQYTVNMSEAFREYLKIDTKNYPSFTKKNKVWAYIYQNYSNLCRLPKNEFFEVLKNNIN